MGWHVPMDGSVDDIITLKRRTTRGHAWEPGLCPGWRVLVHPSIKDFACDITTSYLVSTTTTTTNHTTFPLTEHISGIEPNKRILFLSSVTCSSPTNDVTRTHSSVNAPTPHHQQPYTSIATRCPVIQSRPVAPPQVHGPLPRVRVNWHTSAIPTFRSSYSNTLSLSLRHLRIPCAIAHRDAHIPQHLPSLHISLPYCRVSLHMIALPFSYISNYRLP